MDWKKIIGTVAPTIATAFGTPLAGMATSIVLGTLGIKEEKEIEVALQNPEALLKLKQAENDFALKMKELDIKLDEIIIKDKDSARQREIAVKDKTPSRLAYILIGGFLSVSLIQIVFVGYYPEIASKIPSEGWLLIGNISGYLANEAKQAGPYYFGTTLGSSNKDESRNQIIQKTLNGKL